MSITARAIPLCEVLPMPPLIRRLRADEWELFRDLRYRSLSDAPDAFRPTLAEEQAMTDDEWADLAGRPSNTLAGCCSSPKERPKLPGSPSAGSARMARQSRLVPCGLPRRLAGRGRSGTP
jgi:hypothetical protein